MAFADLRIEPALLAGFLHCLVEDVAEARAQERLAQVASKQGVEPGELVEGSEA